MKRIHQWFLWLLLPITCSGVAAAQTPPTFINVITSSACLTDLTGTPVSQETVTVQAVSGSKQAVNFSVPGTMISMSGPTQPLFIQNGELVGSLRLPNPAVTSPQGVGYTFVFQNGNMQTAYQGVAISPDSNGNYDLCLLAIGQYMPATSVYYPGGDWNGGAYYPAGAVVYNASADQNTYLSRTPSVGVIPGYNDAIWHKIASSGSGGGVGATGPAGTVTVGTTTTGAPGTSAAVTNSGTNTAAVLHFTIPTGATGATGATGPQGTTGATGATGPQGPQGAAGNGAGGLPSGTGLVKVTGGTGGLATAGTDYVLPGGNVATATAFAAAGTPCTGSQLAGGVDASGNSINCASAGALNPSWSRLTHGSMLVAYCDSITHAYGLSDPTQGYASLMAADFNVPLTNRAIVANSEADVWPTEMGPFMSTDQPTQGVAALYMHMCGTNDVDNSTPGPLYNTTQQAVFSFLAIPRENKVMPGDAALSVTGSNSLTPVVDVSGSHTVAYDALTSAGTLTASITTTGNPIDVWNMIQNGLTGTFNVQIDAGAVQGPYSTTPSSTIFSLNGESETVAFTGAFAASGTPAAPVTHQVHFIWVSGTGGIVGLGSIPAQPMYKAPVIVVADIPAQESASSGTISTIATYNGYIAANVAMFKAQGADIREAITGNCFSATSAEMAGGAAPLHPGPLGHIRLAQCDEAAFQDVPAAPLVLPFAITTADVAGSGVSYGSTARAASGSTLSGYTVVGPQINTNGMLTSFSYNFATAPNGTDSLSLLELTSAASGYYTYGSLGISVTPAATAGIQTFNAPGDFTAIAWTSGNYPALYGAASTAVTLDTDNGLVNKVHNGFAPTFSYPYDNAAGVLPLQATVTYGSYVPSTYTVALPGLTTSSWCDILRPNNAAALGYSAYISSVTAGQLTVTNPAIAGLSFSGVCTAGTPFPGGPQNIVAPVSYSAAGTPLPTCAALNVSQSLKVTDAASVTYYGAYTSGGTTTANVICTNTTGSTYAWVTAPKP